MQKPISVDIAEGKAMVAAARRTRKVVQVGMQRRSTPHLVEDHKRSVKGIGRRSLPKLTDLCPLCHCCSVPQ